MEEREPTTDHRAPLSADTAFVVHLTAGGRDMAQPLQGRVEHVVSGRSQRFGSALDLVGFMQRALADTANNETGEIS